jgi:hypothetical protein
LWLTASGGGPAGEGGRPGRRGGRRQIYQRALLITHSSVAEVVLLPNCCCIACSRKLSWPLAYQRLQAAYKIIAMPYNFKIEVYTRLAHLRWANAQHESMAKRR